MCIDSTFASFGAAESSHAIFDAAQAKDCAVGYLRGIESARSTRAARVRSVDRKRAAIFLHPLKFAKYRVTSIASKNLGVRSRDRFGHAF
jgi:hypothetical protein